MIDPADAKEITTGVARLLESLDKFGRGTSATARVDAGGAGVWAATTACLVMLTMSVTAIAIGGMWVSREFSVLQEQVDTLKRESETQEAYLQAIYQIAPHLKPKDQSEEDSK